MTWRERNREVVSDVAEPPSVPEELVEAPLARSVAVRRTALGLLLAWQGSGIVCC